MILSFSGLAEIKTAESDLETIEQWLVRIMSSLDRTTAYTFASTLLDQLSPAVESTALAFGGADTRLCVVLAGFARGYGVPQTLWLSNFDAPWRGLGIATYFGLLPPPDVPILRTAGAFTLRGIWSSASLCLLIHGDFMALDDGTFAILRRLGEPPAGTDANVACDILVEAIRQVAYANPNGPVGPDCWTQIIERASQTSVYARHFRDPNVQTQNPLFFGPVAAIRSVLSQELPSYQTALARLNNGLTTDLLIHGALAAYLDWSPVLTSVCNVMAEHGLDVLPAFAEYLPDLQTLIDVSGYTTADTLERHLQRSNLWSAELSEAYARHLVAENGGKRVSTFRRRVMALLLVGLNPDRYPIQRPQLQRPNDLSYYPWPVDAQLKFFVSEFFRNRRN